MQNITDITFILDKSCSMANQSSQTISAFNEFIAAQKQQGMHNTYLTLVQFADKVESTFNNFPIREVPDLNNKTYNADGRSTSLLDAIGITCSNLGNRLSNTEEAYRPNKVIVVILTDGEENSSKEFCRFSGGTEKIKSMIRHQTDVYSWEFVFLGADLNSSHFAKESLGIDTTASYSGTENLRSAINSVSAYTNASRSGTLDSFDLQKSLDTK